MMKRIKSTAMALFLVMLLPAASPALDILDILKVFGIGYLVTQISGPLNDFINTVTLNKGAKNNSATKVVPIVSFGSGGYIGAAQVSGPKDAIKKTKAVAQLEVSYQNILRTKILVPIDSENPIERFRRVQGVGITALIDTRI